MKVLQIGSDRSQRGILYPGTPAYRRQEAYAKEFGSLDIIAFSRVSDRASESHAGPLTVIPTSSRSSLAYGLDAFRIAKKLQRPDVVSAQDPFEAGFIAWLIARRFNVPLHVQVHTDLFSPQYARHSFLNRIRVHIAAFVLKRAAGIRVVSERLKRAIEERYHPRATISVRPIFADVEAISRARPTNELMAKFSGFRTKLLVVSRLEPEKNVGLSIRAFADAAPQNVCLIVVGEGSERPELEALSRELRVAERVFFEGEHPAAEYYGLADLVLVPSRYEGYGLVIVEALAAGKPVLSTDVGVAREAGVIVSDERRFSDALAAWFTNGPRTGILTGYPYRDFGEYARAYRDDVERCTMPRHA